TELPQQTFRIARADLIQYAGASGDFNPIHWSDRIAASVGLPGVIAHGMYTMALVARAVTTWAGSPAAVRSLSARFTRPVVVPDDDEGTTLVVSGTVSSVSDGLATISMTATCGGQKVLGPTRAVVVC
ncbi:MAG: MaoC/PaaZ C-terminal domain-containing protein, partial [Mycobacteriales bacterium]